MRNRAPPAWPLVFPEAEGRYAAVMRRASPPASVAERGGAGMVRGGHGDDMVPVRSACTVGGVPVAQLIPADRLDAIEARVRKAGGEIVGLLKTGSAFYSPAAAAIQMADAHLRDRKAILPCAAYLEGEYGLRDLYVGVPVQIGAGGVERVCEIPLTPDERRALDTSASHVRELIEALDKAVAGS